MMLNLPQQVRAIIEEILVFLNELLVFLKKFWGFF